MNVHLQAPDGDWTTIMDLASLFYPGVLPKSIPQGEAMVAAYAAVFAILVGLGMVAQWMLSYLAGQIPELKQEPIRIVFHLAAELITAVCLISGGIGLWLNFPWGKSLYLIAMGMLFYTATVSPGYFAQQGDWKWLGIFSGLIIMGLVSVLLIA